MRCNVLKCHAQCCTSVLPISKDEINKIADYIKKNNIEAINRNAGQTVLDKYTDSCPFLGYDYHCTIYEVRPEICRYFACKEGTRDCDIFDHTNKRIANWFTLFFPSIKFFNGPDVEKLNKIYQDKKKKAGIK